MTSLLNERCPLCNRPALKQPKAEAEWWQCDVCTRFALIPFSGERLLRDPSNQRLKPILSAIAREQDELGNDPIRIGPETIEQILALAPSPDDVQERARRLFQHIVRRSGQPSNRVTLSLENDLPSCFATEAEELRYFVRHLEELGWIKAEIDSQRNCLVCTVTPSGWEESRRFPTAVSAKGFVAMWFDASMQPAFVEGIEPAIREDAHYQPVRIDLQQFNEGVVDRILAEIRESRFVVADFTGQRGGVYFEAGFALGLGLPVIWLCRRDQERELHFDIKHFNHILWTDHADLREKLGLRIRATIGLGPLDPARIKQRPQ